MTAIDGFTVTGAVDAFLARSDKPRPPDGHWHPSSAFSCDRLAVYSVRGVPTSDERTRKSRRVLHVGKTIHEIIQRALLDEPSLDAHVEVAVEIPELNVVGSADAVVQVAEDEYELQELKSIRTGAFKYGNLPKPAHVNQARTYAYALRRYGGAVHADGCPNSKRGRVLEGCLGCVRVPPLGDFLKVIRLAYISKDDLEIGEHVVPITDEWDAEFEQQMARLERYRVDGEALPPRLPRGADGKKNWMCGYCEWKTRCWDQDGEGVDLG